jgi:hypothetical protein
LINPVISPGTAQMFGHKYTVALTGRRPLLPR